MINKAPSLSIMKFSYDMLTVVIIMENVAHTKLRRDSHLIQQMYPVGLKVMKHYNFTFFFSFIFIFIFVGVTCRGAKYADDKLTCCKVLLYYYTGTQEAVNILRAISGICCAS